MRAATTLRCALSPGSRIKPLLAPGFARARAAEHHALVQAERAVVPELHLQRGEPEARPVGRAGDVADRVARRYRGNGLLQREAALERARLLRGPGADAAAARAPGP